MAGLLSRLDVPPERPRRLPAADSPAAWGLPAPPRRHGPPPRRRSPGAPGVAGVVQRRLRRRGPPGHPTSCSGPSSDGSGCPIHRDPGRKEPASQLLRSSASRPASTPPRASAPALSIRRPCTTTIPSSSSFDAGGRGLSPAAGPPLRVSSRRPPAPAAPDALDISAAVTARPTARERPLGFPASPPASARKPPQ